MRKLLIYGDSNSFGSAPQPCRGAGLVHPRGIRWGDRLAGELGADWEVMIEGLPGRTAVHDDPVEGAHMNGLTVLPAILHSQKPVDLLAICLGTNDQKHRFGLLAQDVALGVGLLAREALASGIVDRVLLIAPPPLAERGDFASMFSGAEVRGRGLATELARVAEDEGAAFFDAGTAIATDPLDGIHWSADAHAALAEALAPVIRTLV